MHRWFFALLLPLVLVAMPLRADTEHNPSGGGTSLDPCSHAIYQSDNYDAGFQLVDGPPADEIANIDHADHPEIYDALGDWAYSAADTNASWTYSGAETITVRSTVAIALDANWLPDGVDAGTLQILSAFKSEGAIDATSETTALISIPSVAATSARVVTGVSVSDVATVDADDSIGFIYRHLSGLGYFNVGPAALTVEIQQVDPPCAN